MAYYTGAGTTVSVTSTLPATYDEAGFSDAGMTYTVVGELTGVPEHGAEYALVTHNPISDRITRKLKGSVNYGSVTLPMALDPADAGQDIMRDHADGTKVDDQVSMKIEYSDGSVEYFTCLVMSFTTAADGVDSIMAANATIEIDNSVISVAAP